MDGRTWSLFSLRPGKPEFRQRRNGISETSVTFLLATANCVYRGKAGVHTEIFFICGKEFVEKAAALRSRYRNIVLALDGYRAQVSFKDLQVFRENRIVAVASLVHTSHCTQKLE